MILHITIVVMFCGFGTKMYQTKHAKNTSLHFIAYNKIQIFKKYEKKKLRKNFDTILQRKVFFFFFLGKHLYPKLLREKILYGKCKTFCTHLLL